MMSCRAMMSCSELIEKLSRRVNRHRLSSSKNLPGSYRAIVPFWIVLVLIKQHLIRVSLIDRYDFDVRWWCHGGVHLQKALTFDSPSIQFQCPTVDVLAFHQVDLV